MQYTQKYLKLSDHAWKRICQRYKPLAFWEAERFANRVIAHGTPVFSSEVQDKEIILYCEDLKFVVIQDTIKTAYRI